MMLKTSYVCIKKSYSDVQIDGVHCQKHNPLVRNWACTIYEINLNLLFVVTEQKFILSSEVTKYFESRLGLTQ